MTSSPRPGRKVRVLVARFPELGAVRYVEGNRPSPLVLGITAAVVVVFCALIVAGNGDVRDAALVAPWWVALAALILWYVGSEKFVVCERGLLVGSTAPFLRPYVVPFHRVDASSVTAYRPAWKLGAMVARRVPLRQGRSTFWGWNAVAFLAAGAPAKRHVVDAVGLFGPVDGTDERLRPGVWWFGTWHRTDALVAALESAMTDFGAPGARGTAQAALPQVAISGNPADAERQVPRIVRAALGERAE